MLEDSCVKKSEGEIVLAAHIDKSTPAFISIRLERGSDAFQLLACIIIRVTCIEPLEARAGPNGIPTSVAMSSSVQQPARKQSCNQGSSCRSTVEEKSALASRIAPAVVIHEAPGRLGSRNNQAFIFFFA
jgi:hypothetical protein